jgi:putative cell wall-binding protein
VSLAIEAQIATIATVRRLGGADRYEASNAIALDAFRGWTPSHRVFLASGSVFADALAGGAAAGQFDAPLLLARTDCVPPAALDIARGEGIKFVTVLGGPTTLSPQVESLEPCV